jgi:hypothetical protein
MNDECRYEAFAIENVVFVNFSTTKKCTTKAAVGVAASDSCEGCEMQRTGVIQRGALSSCLAALGQRSSNEAWFQVPQLELEMS